MSFVSLYLYVPDEGSLLPKYRDCTTYNDFEYIYIIHIYIIFYFLISNLFISTCLTTLSILANLPPHLIILINKYVCILK